MKQLATLSDDLVAGLTPGPREYTLWDRDLPCLGIRVRTSGHRGYVLMVSRDGGKRRVTLGAACHMDCAAARRAALERIGAAAERPGPKLTLAELVATRWRDEHLMRCKPSTRRTWASLLRYRILPHFGALPLDAITRAAVADWFDDVSCTAPGNANRGLILLGQILNFAVRRGLLQQNVTTGLRKNRGRKMNRFLSVDELVRLYRTMDAHVAECPDQDRRRGRDIITLLILTGCRKGEILNLRWDEVDGDRLRLKDGKTGGRDVRLCAAALAILDRQPRNGGAYVFASNRVPGAPVTTVDSFWRAVRRRAGIEDVRLHDLRHTFASHAVMNGVSLPVVARLLGHARISMTMRYAHVGDDTAEAAAELVGARVAELLAGGG